MAAIYDSHYPEVKEHTHEVVALLSKEEHAFRRTLHKGLKHLHGYRTGVTGAELFVLYDTFGFPVELSTEEAHKERIPVSDSWRAEFDEQMAAQRARSQQATRRGAPPTSAAHPRG